MSHRTLVAAAVAVVTVPVSFASRTVAVAQRVVPPLCLTRDADVVTHGARTTFAWIDASGRDHGALHLAHVPNDALPTLATLRAEHTLAPSAITVALAFRSGDAADGAVAWITGHPERRDAVLAARARNHGAIADPLLDPLGPAARSSGDVWWQRLDANGRPVGTPALVFSEHARALRVAIGASPDGWRIAWTGARVVDGEVRGTVRTLSIDASGHVPDVASDVDFTGQNGDVLAVAGDIVVFSGERCASAGGDGAPVIEPVNTTHEHAPPRGAPPQGDAHEHAGPVIACEPLSLFAADVSAGTVRTLMRLADDAAAVDPLGFIAPIATDDGASLVRGTLDGGALHVSAASRLRDARALARWTSAETHFVAAVAGDRRHIETARWTNDATADALEAVATVPVGRLYAAGDGVLFARTGTGVIAPLVRLDTSASAGEMTSWAGDERLREHLVRARAARAAWGDVAAALGPLTERPGAVVTTRMVALSAALERARGRWEITCDALTVRAHWLARHGAPGAVEQLAHGVCEIPEPIVLPSEGSPVTVVFPGG